MALLDVCTTDSVAGGPRGLSWLRHRAPDLSPPTGPAFTGEPPALAATSVAYADGTMARLLAAAERGDERTLARAAAAVDWTRRPAVDFSRAIRLALEVGAHRTARQLAAEGAGRFPDSAELNEYARLLGPSRILSTQLPADPQAAADMEWLRTHRDAYRGRWVALRGGQLLAAAPTLGGLVEQIGHPQGRGILVTRVY